MKLYVKDLKKRYKGKVVFQNINLDLKDVSAIGIIGESGCGKSTLLRQLSGIEDPDTGEIRINDISPITDKKKFQENIGYVFQQHNLFPHLSIKENITLILRRIKKKDREKAEEIAGDVLKRMFIEEESDKRPNEVSGGQAQRASIARALATDPGLLFLDEPTAALDPVLSHEVLTAVENLRDDGREFIFVTHQIAFLQKFADYIIFMKDGQIVEQGGTKCLQSPQTTELKNFLSRS